jgi:hypothetical protein
LLVKQNSFPQSCRLFFFFIRKFEILSFLFQRISNPICRLERD